MRTDLGEAAPRFEVREAVFGGGAFVVGQVVRCSLRVGELVVAGGFAAGDDHRVVVGVVVRADESEIGQGFETGLAQVSGDLVVAGGTVRDSCARHGTRRSHPP
ncbi:hypothetical protein ACLVWQ_14695 [Streptomyces sp. CWNU-52B]|uniref:hypothetical protein n=1 Tax=unclassified Streptomyces TaxID=2593676 RepID=UPI0039C49328